ncbi:MAG TPA: hypothetical protein VFH78_11450, partial [Candidatus Thermoplasmatota archaeon]|nr:hypothetical protein [Candidatus Thermoplasmatota archaeon]
EKRCPNARVILLTDGEREDLAQGLSARVDGIVQKPLALPELRAILAHLASDATRTGAWQARAKEGASGEVRLALRALDAALEAVEEAHEALRAADAQAAPALRQHLAEAERLALLAHRRVLEVERALSP